MTPLISAPDLLARLDDPDLRVADIRWYLTEPGRGRREYRAGHIPGAIFLDLDADLSAPQGPGRHPLPDPTTLAARLGALGIGSEHTVVAYDDVNGTVAARLWWMLDTLGHRDVLLLDGGIQAYVEAGVRLSTDEPSYLPTRLALADRWSRIIEREELVGGLDRMTLLDVRAGERYRGEVEPVDPVAGHIPTAINAPAGGNTDDSGHFLPPGQLRTRYGELAHSEGGIGDRSVVVSCGSGVTACHAALAMRAAGLPDPILYPGSYSDWSTAGWPVLTGADPGDAPDQAAFESRPQDGMSGTAGERESGARIIGR